jgi:nucleoside-diphosphate-sugar epimerase
MRVFVTGASGWIGSAVLPELIGAGHEVVGLARSDTAAATLAAAGAEVRRGTLDDLDILRDAAEGAEGVVHLAFKHDIAFSGGFQSAAEADRRAVETLGAALAGSGRPLVLASGLAGLAPGRVATERDGLPEQPAAGRGVSREQPVTGRGSFSERSATGHDDPREQPVTERGGLREHDGLPERVAAEQAGPAAAPQSGPRFRMGTAHVALSFAGRGVRSSVLRLPPTVHGDGDPGFLARIVGIARERGVAGYLGDGANRWPAVHVLDAAQLFRLALERASAGSVLHAVGDEGVPIRAVAEVIGRQLGLPVAEVAPEHFAWLGGFLAMDTPASAALTRDLLDWQPAQPGLLDDLGKGHYFRP